MAMYSVDTEVGYSKTIALPLIIIIIIITVTCRYRREGMVLFSIAKIH